jgi:signal transduction histidine kinase
VLWALLTAFVFGVYVIIVGLVGSRLTRDHDLALSLVATGIVAVCFQPVRHRLQTAVNQFIFGDRDDPYAAIARLGRRLDAITTPDELLPAIVESVAQALKLPYAAIRLQSESLLTPAVSYGSLPDRGELLTRPLTYNAEPVGELILAPRTPGEPLAASDLRLVDDLARQIGVAAHAVQLTTDLQRSREQLVIAREEERRRIRNDLHDGLGPVLSGLKLRAETARNLVGDNPRVDALLADIALQTETAVADVRRLVYSLRPPALDDLGLGTALQELGFQSDVPLNVLLPEPMPALSAAVEVAVYRITQEALTNVSRHAGAQSAHVELRPDASTLVMTITDDGRGIPADVRSGVGLRSMRERVSELGGSLSVESGDGGGTTLRITLPLTPPIIEEPDDVD